MHFLRTLRQKFAEKLLFTYSVRAYCTKLFKSTSNTAVLGIETSCDDTGCALVDITGNLLGESLYSQSAIHVRYGGVNPLVAHDLHRENIENVVAEALKNSSRTLKDIDAIAVTTKPGLIISLQVGVKYAKYLARLHNKPLIPIHHMEAHALVARMYYDVPFPFLVLLISGGHCLISVAKGIDDFILLGRGLDNAPGEVLDKVARRMKLKNMSEYSRVSGGRAVELAAMKSTNPYLFDFPLPLLKYRDCNFSFSGLRDSLERKLQNKEAEHVIMGDGIIPEVYDLCAAFQLAVAEHLAHRTKRAMLFCEKQNLVPTSIKNLVVSGGVACNDFIFNSIRVVGKEMGYNVLRPPPRVCTDNGIMIAWNGIEKLKANFDVKSDIKLNEVAPEAPLGTSYINDVISANLPTKPTRLKKYLQYFILSFNHLPLLVTVFIQCRDKLYYI